MGKFKVPCLECGVLTSGRNRCPQHQAIMDARHEAKRSEVKRNTGQYSGEYRKRAKQVRETAVACHLCGKGAIMNDPWEADHLIPGDPYSPLAAAHRSCNQKRGNKAL